MTLATSRQMLVSLGFFASAANDTYRQQGSDSINEWANFDKYDVFFLIRSVRKPGGSGNGKMVCFKNRVQSTDCLVLQLSQDSHQQDSGLWGYHCSCDSLSEETT